LEPYLSLSSEQLILSKLSSLDSSKIVELCLFFRAALFTGFFTLDVTEELLLTDFMDLLLTLERGFLRYVFGLTWSLELLDWTLLRVMDFFGTSLL